MTDLEVRPTPEQLERFGALSTAERYAWLAGMLRTVHALSTDEVRARWRQHKQARSGGFIAVVHAFAAALDTERHDEAATLIAPGCVYDAPTGELRGPAAIVASYASSADWARENLHAIVYRSSVEPTGPGEARITFEDRITHGGHTHIYRCQQHVSVGGDRRITAIRHLELPGQRPAADRFLREVGVAPRDREL